MKNRKKEITLLIIAILVIVSMIAGATYAFFKAQTGPAANFDINATTSTTDNLTFSTEGDIVLNVTAENLKNGGNDLSDTAVARARLIANNSSNSATAYYNVYLLIEENEMEYSSYTKVGADNLIFMTKEGKEKENLEGYTGVPEIILSVKKGETEYKIAKRLTPTDGGYDITEADGLYAIGEKIEITTTSDVTDEWEVKVTFKNLEYNQQLNTGKSLKGKIIITAEKLLYDINDAAGLRKLSEEVNNGDTKEGKYFVLTDDIDLGSHEEEVSNFTPIGTDTNPFQGDFNGDNHIISNLYINNSTLDSIGLFGAIKSAKISNLNIYGIVHSTITSNIGMIGQTSGVTNINNISSHLTITSDIINYSVGGIVGAVQSDSINIEQIQNFGDITNGIYTGGLIGAIASKVTQVIINNSNNFGTIKNDKGNVGGVIGYLNSSNCSTIISNTDNNGRIIGLSEKAGGLIGLGRGNIIIKNCHNKGEITSNNNLAATYVGGIMGYNDGNIEINDSYNIGNITANGENGTTIGGLIGQAIKKVVINNSNNDRNTLKISPSGFDTGESIGGLIGILSNQTEISFINNSYNSGEIVNGTKVGGLIGSLESGIIIDKCNNGGDILVEGEIWSGASYIGSLIGVIHSFAFLHPIDIIINCFNTGNMEANNNTSTLMTGLLSNVNSGNVIILNSYNIGNLNLQSNNGFVSGLVYSNARGLQNQSTENNINKLNNLYSLGKIDGVATNKYNIGYFNPDTTTNDIKNTYYLSDENILESNIEGIGTSMSINEMKSQSFVDELNNNIKSINLEEIDESLKDYTLSKWKLGENGYPTLINE